MSSFTIVHIPHDTSQRIEERDVTYSDETIVSCLTDSLKGHFKKSHSKFASSNTEKLSAYTEMLKSKVKESASGSSVDVDAMAKMLGSMQLVGIEALLPQHQMFDWEAVSMYVDDNAVNKGVTVNRRATEFCHSCGVAKTIYGDAFVARVLDDNNDLFKRCDFKMSDLSSSASWMKRAQQLNAMIAKNRGSSSSAGTSIAAKSKSVVAPTDEAMEKATSSKASGNEAFKSKNFEKARGCYLEAIEALGKPNPKGGVPLHEDSAELARVLWLNISATELALGQFASAADAATTSLEFWPKAKAYYRRGLAWRKLGKLEEAARDFKSGLKLKARDATLQRQLKEVSGELMRCNKKDRA